jgi:hypothetical protein
MEVLARAAKGELDVMPEVQRLFNGDPMKQSRLVDVYGDCYAHARDSMINAAAGKDLAAKEAMRCKIDEIQRELAGPNPTPLERILCERVALCWFDVNEQDRLYGNPQDGVDLQEAQYRESRRDRAHKRFLTACKTLATARRLGVPAIQLNVARRQVNVAGGGCEAVGNDGRKVP